MKAWQCLPPPPASKDSTPSGAESDDDDHTLSFALSKRQKENPRTAVLKRKASASPDIE